MGDFAHLYAVHNRLRYHQVERGLAVVVVLQCVLTRAQLLGLHPSRDAQFVARAAGHFVVDQSRIAGDVLVRYGVVPNHQLVPAGGMPEEIEDALFLHQARDEIEIRLAILNAVLPLGIRFVQLPRDIEALQNFLQNVGNVFVLKDAQVLLARQHPDLGRHRGAVAGQTEGSRQLCEGGHNAVDVSGLAARRPDYTERDSLAQDVLEFDPGVFAPQLQLKREEVRDGLLPRERLDQQFIRTQA